MKKKHIMTFVLVWVCILATIALIHASYDYANLTQEKIASEMIRLHILAHSDSEIDQQIKLELRDEILSFIQGLMEEKASKEKNEDIILANLSAISQKTQELMNEKKLPYPTKCSYGKYFFPYKEYANLSFPSGFYDGLRISIGEAKGQNWWCVMYPPLCYVDAGFRIIDSNQLTMLEQSFDEESYRLITEFQGEDQMEIKIKFKIVEWWQNRKKIS